MHLILKIKPIFSQIRLINVQGRRKMASTLLVDVSEGTVRGKELNATSFSKNKYFAFQGIPYAQPPIRNLRFKDPQPPLAWEGVRDCLQEASSCPQKHVLLKELIGEEDNCLALNVYTPHLQSAEGNKTANPVMVWIHGGGFTFGSGNTDLHDPDYWMERDVVLVTCNYRVGALGFLSLGTEEVPGNAGLKDQVMVLRWVQRNIAHFGGDPNNVTLMGESAGAASVHYHLISPMSRGLFHRAILMSGCCLNSWAFTADAVERSFRLGEGLGLSNSDPDQLLHFLQDLPAFDLVRAQGKVVTSQDKQNIRVFPFTPCVEPASSVEGGERFLTEHPRSLLQRGAIAPVPVIIGANNKEGLLVMNDVPHTKEYLKVIDKNFGRIVPRDMGLPEGAVDTIRRFFLSDKSLDWDTISPYLDFYGDIFFYIGLDESIRLHLASAVAPVYCYRMSFDGQLAFLSWYLRLLYPQCDLKGVSHADDLGYLFKYNIPGPPQMSKRSAEEKMVSLITGLWHQFASSGRPSAKGLEVKWQPAEKNNNSWRGFLELDRTSAWRDTRMEQPRMEFWDSLLHSHSKL